MGRRVTPAIQKSLTVFELPLDHLDVSFFSAKGVQINTRQGTGFKTGLCVSSKASWTATRAWL
jgi:hypothetical protein